MQTMTKESLIPHELTEYRQWVMWKLEDVIDQKTKEIKYDEDTGEIVQTKVPYQINGNKASSTNSDTWTSYKNVNLNIDDYNGIGYVLTENDEYTAIDLDDCIIDGVMTDEAKSIVDYLNSYTEYSQSGEGLHIFVKGKKPGTRSKNSEKDFEMYDRNRFIIMTGNHLEGTPLEINEHQEAIGYLYDKFFAESKPTLKAKEENIQQSPSLTDDEVIKIASNAKNSDKFKALYEKGDIKTFHNGDDSSADQGLANILAFYTQDPEQIERLMRQSALNRDKWDKHSDYLLGENYTIEKAINDLTATFQQKKFELHVKEKTDIPKLHFSEKGAVKKLLFNLKEILRCDSSLKEIGFNEFTQEVTIKKEPITDDVISKVRYRVDSQFQVTFTKDDVIDMLGLLARERNSYHPIKEIIESRTWDKISRTETVFIDYLGAEDNNYTRSITKKWLAGAIARIYEPGIKMEIVPVLQGNQGIGKSTIAAKLGKGFFVDSLASLGNTKDDYQLLIGSWIVELSELSSLGSTKVEKMKGFISAQFDKIRLPYGKVTQNYYRTCVFIGTTNTTQFLNDLTGNRRFFPIPLESKPTRDVFNIDDDIVQQIWAEAYELYKQGEKLFLDKEDEEVAELYRDEAMEENLFYQEIDDYLSMKVPKDWNNLPPHQKKERYSNFKNIGNHAGIEYIDRTTAKEIAYVLNVDSTNHNSQSQMKKINLYMGSLDDWKKKSVYIKGKTEQGYKR